MTRPENAELRELRKRNKHLELSRPPYYRWLRNPVTERDLAQAYRMNALHDAHLGVPEFGGRFLADEVKTLGESMCDRIAWQRCRDQGWWSVLGKKQARGKGKKPGPPVYDDLVQREFMAAAPNQFWLSDITEHWTSEGRLYLCAVKDVWSNRTVGCSIPPRLP